MAYPEYYNELGVAPSADMKEIKSAYRKLAKKYHPDLNPGDKKAEEKLKKINVAYDVLSDFSKRAEYDYFGQQAEKAMQEDIKRQQEAQSPVYKKNQYNTEKQTETTFRKTKPQKETTWRVLIARQLIVLLVAALYIAFLMAHADKNDPQNIQKMFKNSSEALVQNILGFKQEVANFYDEFDIRKKLLFIAVKNNWIKNIKYILKEYPSDEFAQITDDKGYSLLMYAKSREAAEILYEYGANMNYTAPDGETPYSQAEKNNHRDIIDLFIEKGMQIRLKKPRKTARPRVWKKRNSK